MPDETQKLLDYFRKNAVDVTTCAHAAVDVHIPYEWPEPTRIITKVLAPAFRAMAIPTYWIYLDVDANGPEAAGLSIYPPPPGDSLFPKYRFCTFDETDLHDRLQDRGIKTLIVTGYVLSVCVQRTIESARNLGYNVILVRDATDEKQYGGMLYAIDQMKEDKGIAMTYSSDLLSTLHILNPSPRP